MTTNTGIPSWSTEMVRLGDGIYAYIQAKGTWMINNTGLIVGDDFAILVDTHTTVSCTNELLKEVRAVTDKNIRYLIVTHHHPDHCLGNHLITGAISIAHSKCREELKKMEPGTWPNQRVMSRFPEFDFTGTKLTLPDITYDKALTLHTGNREVDLIYYGVAHTLGDTVVRLPQDDIVFCGDLLFYYVTPLGVQGSILNWIDALTKLAELNARVYVPGHGPPTDRNGLLKCREYLSLVTDEASKFFKDGIDASEAASRIQLGEFAGWGDPERTEMNINRLYGEFKGEGPEIIPI